VHYKVWVEIEEIDDDNDHYERVDEPFAIGDHDTIVDARLQAYSLARLFNGLIPSEIEHFHSAQFLVDNDG
jgi:hypothetical protein